ncbi:peptidoglycan DD-metalloendopeptidase family protein [Immundisolibacter sp.]|uniref:peptidoglycan DD-metalloendopeptidase family protein n=1 Tax=Immundisolibacter sp. TaxID=1934948 RepID=UPI0025BB87A0|nr:peptidoglycan DD-metalloendopeptidase family protein [Immundisolibacter sp.]
MTGITEVSTIISRRSRRLQSAPASVGISRGHGTTSPDPSPARHLLPWAFGSCMALMVAMLVARTAESLASIPERLNAPAVERPYPLPEIEAATGVALEQLDEAWLEHRIRPGESFFQAMRAMGFGPGTVQSVMDAGQQARSLLDLKPGQVLRASAADGELMALDLEIDPLNKLEVRRDFDGYSALLHTRPTQTVQAQAAGVINSSLYMSAQQAGLSDRLVLELAEMFGWDIDFTQDLQPGDRFAVIYNELTADGEKVRDGDILAAEFVNKGKVLRAVRYTDPDGRVAVYKPDGSSMRKAFSRNPLPVTRITSRFNPNRLHPIFKTVRPHRGVDYGAATGTPVQVTGDGQVAFAGRQGGYGNVLIIDHGRGNRTLYAHLSRFAPNMRVGQRVNQGQVIGYVGSTGWATGPHLHYEFQVNGQTKDPLTVALPNAQPLPDAYRRHFLTQTSGWVAKLDALATRRVAQTDPAQAQ